jgi:UDPglucose 6-dehydrogenase
MTADQHRLAVIGLGKLGSPMAACFAAKGFEVVGADLNEAYVQALNDGRAPVFEPGLDEMIAAGRERLRATTSTREAAAASDIVFLIVPTPSDDDGTFSLRYVLEACAEVGAAVRDRDGYPVVCLTSTVMPGATGGPVREALEAASGKRAGIDFGLCYSPEFIALGSVVRDFLNPDFLLLGESDDRAGEIVSGIYARTVENDAPVARMSFVNAELAKIAVNTFVTTKITFANMLARICERLPDGDVDVVANALGLDTRIGRKYLTGAIAYGGPCFPRDNVALGALARSLDAPATLAEATDTANREEKHRLADLAESYLGDDDVVAVLGLSYKPETNVVEESAGLQLVHELATRGHAVVAHDPAASENARQALSGLSVEFAESARAALERAAVVVVATPWDEYTRLDARVLADGRARVIVDCWRVLDEDSLPDGVTLVRLGKQLPDVRETAGVAAS